MYGTDARDWIANSSSDRVGPHWAPDLGYFVGYQIAKAYYERETDKRKAIRDLLQIDDAGAILRASGYAARFARGAGAGRPTGGERGATAREPEIVRSRVGYMVTRSHHITVNLCSRPSGQAQAPEALA
jgi:hypothetical protein